MGKQLKALVGQHKDTRVKIATIENLNHVKGNYVGSGFNVEIKDLDGREIAKFQISGIGFDKSIPTLLQGITDDLRIRKEQLKGEIRSIEDTIG